MTDEHVNKLFSGFGAAGWTWQISMFQGDNGIVFRVQLEFAAGLSIDGYGPDMDSAFADMAGKARNYVTALSAVADALLAFYGVAGNAN